MVMRGEKMPKDDAWRKATVGSSAEHRLGYWRIWCEDCRHELIMHARDIIQTFKIPPETPFRTLAQKLVCSKCRSIKVGIMASSYDPDKPNR
jgi:hypothetical protein